MAVLNIRRLPDETHAKLRIRAARAARSMEAEARAILVSACATDENGDPPAVLQEWVAELYGASKPHAVTEEFIRSRREQDAE
jgi:plasmid stability protein